MRQIFFALPYVCPREPARIADLIRAHGTLRKVAAGGVLKRGGDANRLFLLEEGICAYFVAGATTGHSTIMSLLLPGTTLCDMTSSVGRRCNVETRAVQASKVWCTAPDFYERHVFTNPELAVEKYQHAVGKQEATLEGMIANFTLPPEQRVKILLKAVLLHEQAELGSDWTRIPYDLPAQVIGQAVNLTRQTVAQVIGDWRRAGLARRAGRHLEVLPALFDDIYDWIEHRGGCLPDWHMG